MANGAENQAFKSNDNLSEQNDKVQPNCWNSHDLLSSPDAAVALKGNDNTSASSQLPDLILFDSAAKPGEQTTEAGERPLNAVGDGKPDAPANTTLDQAQNTKDITTRMEEAAKNNDLEALQVLSNTIHNTCSQEQMNEINKQLENDHCGLHIEGNGSIGGDTSKGCVAINPAASKDSANSNCDHVARTVKCGETTVGLDAEGNIVSYKANGFGMSKHPDGQWYVHNDKNGGETVAVDANSIIFNKKDGNVFFTERDDCIVADPENGQVVDPLSRKGYHRLDTDKLLMTKDLAAEYKQKGPTGPEWANDLATGVDILNHLPGPIRYRPNR